MGKKPVVNIGDSVEIDNNELATVVGYASARSITLDTSKGKVVTNIEKIRSKSVFASGDKKRSIEMETKKNTNGELIRCIKKDGSTVVVEFEDGERVTTSYFKWRNGNVFQDKDSTTGGRLMTDSVCVGSKVKNRNGVVMECLHVRDDDTIDVCFQGLNIVKLGMSKLRFSQGVLDSDVNISTRAITYNVYRLLPKNLVDALLTGKIVETPKKDDGKGFSSRVKVEDYTESDNSYLSAKESLDNRLLKRNVSGKLIACVKYESSVNVDVWVKDSGIVKLGVAAQQFKNGTVSDVVRPTTKYMNIDEYMEKYYPYIESAEELNEGGSNDDPSPKETLSLDLIKYLGLTRQLDYGVKAKIVWYRNMCDIDIAFTDSNVVSQHCDLYTFKYGSITATTRNSEYSDNTGLRKVVPSSELDNPRLLLSSFERIALRKLGVKYAGDIVDVDPYDIRRLDSDNVNANKITFLRESLVHKFSKE